MLGYSRWQLFKGAATGVAIVSIVSLVLIYFIPAPPSKITMATAFKGSSFEYWGRQYREIFARSNVELELRETAGAPENLKLLQDPKSGVQIALVIGGVSDVLRIAQLEFCRLRSGPCSCEGESLVGGVNRLHRGRGAASNNLLCEGTVATADIEPSKAPWSVQPVEKHFAYRTAPTPHHALISFSVGEMFVSSTHETHPVL